MVEIHDCCECKPQWETLGFATLEAELPFQFVDSIHSMEDLSWKTSFTIPEGHVFVENGKFLEAGFIEVTAQSVAAGMTLKNEDDTPRVGFIGEVKQFDFRKEVLEGAKLEITGTLVGVGRLAVLVLFPWLKVGILSTLLWVAGVAAGVELAVIEFDGTFFCCLEAVEVLWELLSLAVEVELLADGRLLEFL